MKTSILLLASLILLSPIAHADGEDDGCSASEGPKPAHCTAEPNQHPYIGQDGKMPSTPDHPVPVTPGSPGPAYCELHPGVCH